MKKIYACLIAAAAVLTLSAVSCGKDDEPDVPEVPDVPVTPEDPVEPDNPDVTMKMDGLWVVKGGSGPRHVLAFIYGEYADMAVYSDSVGYLARGRYTLVGDSLIDVKITEKEGVAVGDSVKFAISDYTGESMKLQGGNAEYYCTYSGMYLPVKTAGNGVSFTMNGETYYTTYKTHATGIGDMTYDEIKCTVKEDGLDFRFMAGLDKINSAPGLFTTVEVSINTEPLPQSESGLIYGYSPKIKSAELNYYKNFKNPDGAAQKYVYKFDATEIPTFRFMGYPNGEKGKRVFCFSNLTFTTDNPEVPESYRTLKLSGALYFPL